MTTSSTSLLGLALPVTGELNGTWGDVVNNSLTSLLDTAIAGTTVLSTDADVTLTTTALAANQARQAVLLCSGARTALRTITAPAQSKIYVVINNTSGGYGVKVVGVGPTTGVTIPAGKVYMLVWNGSDFVTTGVTTVDLTTDVTGILPTANGGTGLGGATPFTANGVVYASNSSTLTTGSTLTFVGNQLFVNSVAVGRGSGSIFTNTALGSNTLSFNSTGSSNTAVGQYAIFYNTTGSSNTAVGREALFGASGQSTGSFNTAVGQQAIRENTTGSNNTAVGYQAGYSNTTGNITAFGTLAGFSNTTGTNNVAIGVQALYSNTTQNSQTAVGYQAMYYMRGGINTAIGSQALRGSATPANNTGDQNVAIGLQTLYSATSSSNNVAIGTTALFSTTTGGSNTAVGDRTLVFNIGGSANTAVGNYALYNSNASSNVAVGAQAAYLTSTGSLNTAIGTTALLTNSTGSRNTAIGQEALYTATGDNNTAVGEGSGFAITTGSKNTIVGRYTGNQGGLDIRTASNYVVLSDGDGNPRAYWNGANATFNGALSITATFRSAVGTVASGATITPTSDSSNQYNVTALAVPATIAAPSGTPVDGQKLLIRLKDNGTAMALTWNATYRVIGVTLPTTTVATKTTYVGCIYNSADAVWDVVAVTTQA